MKVVEKNKGRILDVHGVYWVGGIRYYYVIPYEGYEGLTALGEHECDIIDESFDPHFRLVKNSAGVDMLLHEALIRDALLDSLLEHYPSAMPEFRKRLTEYQDH